MGQDPDGHLDSTSQPWLTQPVIFDGLLDHDLDEVIEFYPSKEAAKAELAEILQDEPDWVEKLEIVVVDFPGPEAAVTRIATA